MATGGEVTLRLDGAAIARLVHSPAGPIVQDLFRRATRVQIRARELAPSRTGKLRKSIIKRGPYKDNVGPLGIYMVVLSNLNYALFVHEGTNPHPIHGNPLLAFYWANGPNGPGNYIYASVNHPGTKPNPFLLRALEVAR